MARALLHWIRLGDATTLVPDRRAPDARMTVRILPPAKHCPRVLIDFLIEELGADQLLVTPAGVGIPNNLLSGLSTQARSLLGEGTASPADPPATTPVQAPTSTSNEPSAVRTKTPRVKKRTGFEPWTLCDAAEVRAQLASVAEKHHERKRVLEALAARPVRYLPITRAKHVDAVMGLRREFPHFAGVIDSIADSLSLCAKVKAPLKLPPTLLLGAPGLGKTCFCKRLAERLGFEICERSLAEMSASFVLIGGSSSWADSKPGIIAGLLARMRDDHAPLLLLDELDKVKYGSNYPPDTALLGLFEPHTARGFREENLDVVLNVEPVTHLLTANRLQTVRPEILSRLRIAEIRPPSGSEMEAIVRSVDQTLRSEYPRFDEAFEPLSDEVTRSLSAVSPRDLRALLLNGYSRVARRDRAALGRLTLSPADFVDSISEDESHRPDHRRSRPYIMPIFIDDQRPWTWLH